MAYQPPHKRTTIDPYKASSDHSWTPVKGGKVSSRTKPEEFPALGAPAKPLAPVTKSESAPVTKSETKPETKPESAPVSKPELASVPETAPVPKMNFAALFKNAVKKKKPKPMKWGLIKLTKHGIVDSLTPEEHEAIEKEKIASFQEQRLLKAAVRLETSRDLRREYDANYESPPDLSVTTSEEVSTEEEEVLTDEVEEDEFEPEI